MQMKTAALVRMPGRLPNRCRPHRQAAVCTGRCMMYYEAELTFLQSFLKRLSVDVSFLTPGSTPSPAIDRGLRELLHTGGTRDAFLALFTPQKPQNIIYKLTDDYFCRYIFLLLPDTVPETAMVIGPYTSTNVSDQTVMELMQSHSLLSEFYPHMISYYSSVPILWDDSALLAVLDILAEKLWHGPGNYEIRTLEFKDPNGIAALSDHYSPVHFDSTACSMEMLERRYQAENRLLHAIALGQTQKADAILAQLPWGMIEPRTADSIRNLKNYMIIVNTLMRKAAEQGLVHPLHIDNLSGYFARKIELINHQSDLPQLAREMVHKYCLLVQNHSLKAYSLPVRKVISNIDFDLSADLSLKAQAALLQVNPSYLSSLFKKETGTTLTDYVNQKRIKYAIFLLNSTTLQVQAIAQQCGIGDVNYFSKTFKKLVGQTPLEYRKNILQS